MSLRLKYRISPQRRRVAVTAIVTGALLIIGIAVSIIRGCSC